MSDGGAPGGCIPEWFVVDLGCLVYRREDPCTLGVRLGGGEKGSYPPCLLCIC